MDKVVMMMEHDAQGFLLNIVPIALRINVFIVNIDTSIATRVSYYFNVFKNKFNFRMTQQNLNITFKSATLAYKI